MTIIAPTITTDTPAVYQSQLDNYLSFAPRIQIDVTDGEFTPSKTINLNQLYWPSATQRQTKIDLHLMINTPITWLNQIVSLHPDKVILHAESKDAANILPKIFSHLRQFGMEVGVALLPETQPADYAELIELSDSVLIFGGHLGYQGGQADLSLLNKISEIKYINPKATIEWDGGANEVNVSIMAQAGIDQINVGSAISSADDAKIAYEQLATLVN